MRPVSLCLAALAAVAMPARAAELRISGPYTHENLAIYLVHGPDRVQKDYLTLAAAIEQRKVVVHETSDVNRLQVENLSDQDVYIQSGEIVKGGKQDRVLSEDLILPTSSGKVNVRAFCVEQGRWTQRGRESVQAFAAAPNAIATPELKRAVKAANQRAVWREVSAAQDRLAVTLGAPVKSVASESSYQLSLEAPKVQQRADSFKKALSGLADRHSDALGYVMAVNGKVTGADLYASHALFSKLWPKLMHAAAVEAMAVAKPAGTIAMPRMEDVRAAAGGNEALLSSEMQINRRTMGMKADLPGGLVFETRDTEAPGIALHRSYLAK